MNNSITYHQSIELTCNGWSEQNRAALEDRDEAHGAGEPAWSYHIHEALEEQGTHHAVHHSITHCIDHQPPVTGSQRAQQVAHTIVGNGEAEEVLDPGPNAGGVGEQTCAWSGKHVHERQCREQAGSRVLVHATVLGIRCQEDHWGKKGKAH